MVAFAVTIVAARLPVHWVRVPTPSETGSQGRRLDAAHIGCARDDRGWLALRARFDLRLMLGPGNLNGRKRQDLASREAAYRASGRS